MIKEKILIVTPYFPYPINSGGAQAQFHMINYLRKYIQISLAFTYTPTTQEKDYQKELQEMWPDVAFYPFAIHRKKFLFRKCRQLLRSLNSWPEEEDRDMVNPELTMSFDENVNYKFIDYLGKIIKSNGIKLVQFEFPKFQNMVYAFPNIKRVFVQHEIQFVRNLRFLKSLDNLSSCDSYQYNMLKCTEMSAMRSCDAIIVLTEIDKQVLVKEEVTTPIFVSPAIIPIPNQGETRDFQFCNKLVFLGSSDHKPNLEGIMWFLENTWKHILQQRPSTQLQIIGKWQHRYIDKITANYKNVELTGYVPSIEPYIKNAIMIVPILTGSGMRMKIIDAANYGIPFVTTQVGVEGLDFKDNLDCFIENDPILFAEKTLKLMEDNYLQKKFSDNAFEKIKSIYPTNELLEKRLSIYQELLND